MVIRTSSVPRGAARLAATASLLMVGACAGLRTPPPVDPFVGMTVAIEDLIAAARAGEVDFAFPAGTTVDTLRWDDAYVEVVFSERLSTRPFRPEDVSLLSALVKDRLAPFLHGRDISVVSLGVPVAELVPNFYRGTALPVDSSRIGRDFSHPQPIVENMDRAFGAPMGLDGKNIALWPSHGWYYDNRNDVWRWQRLRMFQTVEDLLTMSFAVPFLTPMLENAGANVFLPRERDPQVHMAVVDADSSRAVSGRVLPVGTWTRHSPGFTAGTPPYPDGYNPFLHGSYLASPTDSVESARISWVPDLPADGEYAVYVSYATVPDGVEDAWYAVLHAGGRTDFRVNQTIGGGTWVYLGTFAFPAGSNADSAAVMLFNRSAHPGRVTADAVRFGGGHGLISRNGQTSGRPRFVEGARYYLQYAGMPDTLVYSLHSGDDDYRDDYQSRGEWVNYLRGAPFGPNRDRSTAGLGIPIDVSLALHTDAGTLGPDTTVGTLAIYSLEGADSSFAYPDGVSRFANRDLADLVQTQLVGDLRALHDSTFSRRSLLEAQYSEAVRPNVPALLLELLSHQNPEDARLGLDPRVRFDASRAIYKGVLKFIAFQNGSPYVVQPLPVTHFSAILGDRRVRLRWRAAVDPLEPTATPDGYVVYTRKGRGGWDNGTRVDATEYVFEDMPPDVMYSFRVTAANAGGQSFPSETLSVCRVSDAAGKVLVINGFDRVAPPEFIEADSIRGVAFFADGGVPYGIDHAFTGYQYNFNDRQAWRSDDAPYHGASHADFDTVAVAGNTFDFTGVHGESLRAAGFSFDSISDEAVSGGTTDLGRYAFVDLILGEEKSTGFSRSTRAPEFETFPESFRRVIADYLNSGGRLFVSGAHVASDLTSTVSRDSMAKYFADSLLHISMVTMHASRRGEVYTVDTGFSPERSRFRFNTSPSPDMYAADAVDGLRPVGRGARPILRYAENNLVAGVGYRGNFGVVVFGFPFEIITTREDRDLVMRKVTHYLLAE